MSSASPASPALGCAAPPGDLDRSIDWDDHAFVSTLLADSHQELLFKGWVDCKYHSDDQKKRILLVSNFRLITVKVNLLRRSVRQNFSLLSLVKISSPGPETLCLSFSDNPNVLQLHSVQWLSIFQSLLFAYRAINFGRPTEDLILSDIPALLFEGFSQPEPDPEDGLIASYLAYCDYYGIPQRISVLDYFMTCFQINDHFFSLSECFSFLERENTQKDIPAIAAALRYSDFYEEFTGSDFLLKDAGLTALAGIFSHETPIKRLELINIRASKGFSSFATAFALGKHSLTHLTIANNAIGDSIIIKIIEALEAGKKVLNTLCLRDTGISSKAVVQLVSLLTKKEWLGSLKLLDLSDNKLGKTGSAALGTWLNNENNSIEQLLLAKSDLDTEALVKAILANNALFTKHLRVLNISNNRIHKKTIPLLCELFSRCQSLNHIFLAGAELPKFSFLSLLDSCINNNTPGIQFTLDFSRNDLGSKSIKELAALYDKWEKQDAKRLKESGILHTLILSENDLGVEGLQMLLKILRGSSIHTLNIDCNVKLGLFSNGKEAGDSLASFIQGTPALKALSIQGDDNKFYLKTALLPLFSCLKDNRSLKQLDVSRNRLGDESLIPFMQAISENVSLEGFNIENNRISLLGLQELHRMAQQNRHLVDWIIPMADIERICKGNQGKLRAIQSMVADMELNMERNEEEMKRLHQAISEAKEKPAAAAADPRVSTTVISYTDPEYLGTVRIRPALSEPVVPSLISYVKVQRKSIYQKKAASRALGLLAHKAQSRDPAVEEPPTGPASESEEETDRILVPGRGRQRKSPDEKIDEEGDEEEDEEEDKSPSEFSPTASPSIGASTAPASPMGTPAVAPAEPKQIETKPQAAKTPGKLTEKQEETGEAATVKAQPQPQPSQTPQNVPVSTTAQVKAAEAPKPAAEPATQSKAAKETAVAQPISAPASANPGSEKAPARALSPAPARPARMPSPAPNTANQRTSLATGAAATSPSSETNNKPPASPLSPAVSPSVEKVEEKRVPTIVVIDKPAAVESPAVRTFRSPVNSPASAALAPAILTGHQKSDSGPPPARSSLAMQEQRDRTASVGASPALNPFDSRVDWKIVHFPYDSLKSATSLPDGVEAAYREFFLNDAEFQERFGMNKEAYAAIPKWRQQALKSKNGLF